MVRKEIEKLNNTRIENTKKLINEKYSTLSNLANALGKSVSYLSHLLTGNRVFTEKTARELESALGLESFSLDQAESSNTVNLKVYDNSDVHPVLSRSIKTFNRKCLQVIYAQDDAMVPIIDFGQGVVFDKSQVVIHSGSLYALSINQQIIIRRVFVDILTRKLTLKAESSKYEAVIVDDASQLQFLGKIVLALEKSIT